MGRALCDLKAGDRLGKYKILSELATGGMVSIYVAEHALVRRKVAIKVHHAQNAELRSWVQREAELLAAMEHPGIVSLYDMD